MSRKKVKNFNICKNIVFVHILNVTTLIKIQNIDKYKLINKPLNII